MSDIKALVRSWVNSNEEFSVDFDLLWKGLGYNRKNEALELLLRNFSEPLDFFGVKQKSTGGRPAIDYKLSVECAKSFCMMANTNVGKQVRSYFIECERQLKQVLQTNIKSLSQKEVIELAYEALGRQVAQNNYCADKPGLRNIIEQASKPKDYKAFDALLMDVEAIAFRVFNVELSPGELMSLGRLCAGTYRTWHNEEPKKVEDPGIKKNVCVYGTEMYATIENWLINKGYSV